MDSRVIEALKGPVRVLLMALFLLLSKMGWITYATPEAMHAQVNAILDFLVIAAPSAYAIWVFFQGLKANKPEVIIDKAAVVAQADPALARDLAAKVDTLIAVNPPRYTAP